MSFEEGSYDFLADRLRSALSSEALLATRQQNRQRFSPSLSYGRHFAPPQPTAKKAAVMVMLESRAGVWTIPLTERPHHLPDHPGQISLPGGRLESGETHEQAAKREFCEELGVQAFPGIVLGELLPIYVFNSDYRVKPLLAICSSAQQYQPCTREVESLLHLPVSLLCSPEQIKVYEFARGKVRWTSPVIEFQDHKIWGATAIILGELAALLSSIQRVASRPAR